MKQLFSAIFLTAALPCAAESQLPSPYPCIVEQGFLYEQAAFPSCHATTVVQLPTGEMMAAYFGGTYEGHPDCCIWTSRYDAAKRCWTSPTLLADGIYTAATRQAFDYDADFESKNKLKLGSTYQATIKLARNVDFHRKYFKLISIAWELMGEKTHDFFKNSERRNSFA